MLVAILRNVAAQILAAPICAGRCEPDGIEFVVAHHTARVTGIDHPAHDGYDLHLCRPAVDQVTQKDCLPTYRRLPGSCFDIAEFAQERFELARLSMHVTDNVVVHADLLGTPLSSTMLRSKYRILRGNLQLR